jgi:hypothetical protein
MQSTTKMDHGAEADRTVKEIVAKSKAGEGTLTYTPNTPRKAPVGKKAAK